MKYILQVNNYPTDGRFADEEALKAYLIKWNTWGNDTAPFIVQDDDEVGQVVTVDELVKALLTEDKVVCESPRMCEMGDDYVDLLLIVI